VLRSWSSSSVRRPWRSPVPPGSTSRAREGIARRFVKI